MTYRPVVIFAPYSAIWPHALPEALVASAVKQAGAEVIYVPCDGMMIDGCAAMSAHRMSHRTPLETRKALCGMCRKRRDALSDGLRVKVVTMDSLLPQGVRDEMEVFVQRINVADIMALEVDGFKVGQIAMHETIIHFKLTALEEMTDEALADFRVKLLHVLLCLRVTQALVERLSPARIINYNTQISTNHIMMLAAEQANVSTFGLHAGGNMAKRLSSLYVFRQNLAVLYKDWMFRFDREWAQLPTTAAGVRDAAQHFSALTSGKTLWVYSPPKQKNYFDVRSHYGIAPDQKVLLATLSSYDELFSGQTLGIIAKPQLMFPTQVEWMQYLIAHVAKRPDLFLLIRVHPRELPNLRDKLHSTHAKKLAEALVNLPPNVRINWPQEGISLYDLLPQVNVGLNGWSSTGKELALMGIPVVVYTGDILFYPASLNSLACDRDDYFRRIDQVLQDGWSFERIRQVFRWLAVEYTLGTIDISDRFTYKEGARSLLRRAIGRLRRTFAYRFEASRLNRPLVHAKTFVKVILDDASLIDMNIAQQGRLDVAEEDRLIRQEMKNIVQSLYSQVPPGASTTIDALRSATGAGRT
jgi:hypothetical protein